MIEVTINGRNGIRQSIEVNITKNESGLILIFSVDVKQGKIHPVALDDQHKTRAQKLGFASSGYYFQMNSFEKS